jgi:hypothetical protein
MSGTDRNGEPKPQFGFEARCSWCGRVEVGHESLHVFLSRRGAALFEFSCPECERVNYRPLSIADLEALSMAGILPKEGRAPFELLEDRSGPPIGWDDLIDFHQALARAEADLEIVRIDQRGGDRTLERDAA